MQVTRIHLLVLWSASAAHGFSVVTPMRCAASSVSMEPSNNQQNNNKKLSSSSSLSSRSGRPLQSSFAGNNFGNQDDARYRELLAKARGYAYYRNSDMGAPSPQDAQQVLDEIFSMEDWCTSTATASPEVCENADEVAELVVRLRALAATSEEKTAVMFDTVYSTMTLAVVLMVVVASFVSSPTELVDATTAASTAADLEDFSNVAVDGFIWTM